MELGQDDQARKELEMAVPIFRDGNNLNSLAISLAQLGEIAFNAGDIMAAEKAYEECIEVCMNTGNKYIESRARKDLWQMYRENNKDKGLLHLERYVDLQNQLTGDKTLELMQDFNVRYDTLKKEQTIALQKNRLIYLSIVLLLFIALAASGAFLAVFKNKAAKAMEEKNALLVKSNLDKDRLLAIAKAQIPKEITDEILSIASSTEAIPAIKLTRREMQIAELCAKGMISKEIADRLGISQRTVETHKNHIYKKLGINNTVELMQYIQKVFTDHT
jgi:DNA-binding CsgD family transcriptional regulator